MSELDRPGVREAVAVLLSEGASPAVIATALDDEFCLDVTDRTVRRWRRDAAVQAAVREHDHDRQESQRRRAEAALARRLEEGNTDGLSTLDLLRIAKDARGASSDDPAVDIGAWDSVESAAVASLWSLLNEHAAEHPALAHYLSHGDPDDDETAGVPPLEGRERVTGIAGCTPEQYLAEVAAIGRAGREPVPAREEGAADG
jgi:hypothetical protein